MATAERVMWDVTFLTSEVLLMLVGAALARSGRKETRQRGGVGALAYAGR
jgi:uncharacterized membrane protein